MSAGAFLIRRYAASYGAGDQVHPIRVQPETIAATIDGTANAQASGALTNPISAVVSRGKRGKGLIARAVTLRAPESNAPDGYKPGGTTIIPALSTAFYNKAVAGASCTYLGATFTVVGTRPEVAQ